MSILISSSTSSQHIPVRTISLPSRAHPILHKFDAVLNHLKTWQILSESETAPFGAESLQIGLVGLAELYSCVDEILLSPQYQKALLCCGGNEKILEHSLDGSLTMLETCNTAKEIAIMIKQHVSTLQSAFRRKRISKNSRIGSSIENYIHSRKNVQKEISICLKELKKLKIKVGIFLTILDSNQHLSEVVRVIREASNITISIFRFLLLFLSMPTTMKTKGGFSLISKLLKFSSSNKEEKMMINEVKSLDISVLYMKEKLESKEEMETIERMLETINLSLDNLEVELQCMSRCLVQNRVTLLNIFTQ